MGTCRQLFIDACHLVSADFIDKEIKGCGGLDRLVIFVICKSLGKQGNNIEDIFVGLKALNSEVHYRLEINKFGRLFFPRVFPT